MMRADNSLLPMCHSRYTAWSRYNEDSLVQNPQRRRRKAMLWLLPIGTINNISNSAGRNGHAYLTIRARYRFCSECRKLEESLFCKQHITHKLFYTPACCLTCDSQFPNVSLHSIHMIWTMSEIITWHQDCPACCFVMSIIYELANNRAVQSCDRICIRPITCTVLLVTWYSNIAGK